MSSHVSATSLLWRFDLLPERFFVSPSILEPHYLPHGTQMLTHISGKSEWVSQPVKGPPQPLPLILGDARGFGGQPRGQVEAVSFLPHLLAVPHLPSQTLVHSEVGPEVTGPLAGPVHSHYRSQHQWGHRSLQGPPPPPACSEPPPWAPSHLPASQSTSSSPRACKERPSAPRPPREPGTESQGHGSPRSPAAHKPPAGPCPLGSPQAPAGPCGAACHPTGLSRPTSTSRLLSTLRGTSRRRGFNT